ncbi:MULTISPECIES: glutamate--tRNA ligase [unclassified Aureimonas]|uniref:glutamate--tRNA ligase n=1 Tax=unclassified Aureimonas TaxID=2615206 RepID=UPI0006F7987A|nr:MULTISPECIES: glutamate--tRNA ligase [unclassified Aureimonas]KQT57580.1 glutamine--tRNA ligase [Aureimonas sp. Leaf427]KQT77076.1 glutamine--tRNA ligase [Aureimonas sp. Leaf460]
MIVRFAPSPTGLLHIGNLRTALLNWLTAKERGEGGTFVLRYDDTDLERSRREYADAILEDLAWIGIHPDLAIRQSERLPLYDDAVERLKADGLLYACYETPDELDVKRKRRAARGLPPVYGREALKLDEAARVALEAQGLKPHWRFLLPNHAGDPFAPVRTDIVWDDLLRGTQTVDLASLSDPVLVREDGSYLYTLPSVVDDGAVGVTDVIRGGDHITNTGVQIALFQALGLPVPRFGHHNLLTTLDGEGLSKRTGALSLRSLREDGLEPMAVASLAVLVGLSGSIEAVDDLGALAERLVLKEVSASASKFDPAEVERLNQALVHRMPYEAAAERLRDMAIPEEQAEAFWAAVRGNCVRVGDAVVWRDVVYGAAPDALALSAEDRAFAASAFDLLPPGPFDGATWASWTGAVKAATGRKGRALFMPLRIALTGLDHGPELAQLLPLIGHDRAAARRPA